MDEQIVLLDERGRPTGTAPKLASHHGQTPLHQGFSCYIFNENGEFLLTRRAKSKKVWPGVWTNSVCGHPAPGETIEDAIKRRAEYELGIAELSDIKPVLKNYRYKTPPFNGIVENEFCPVYYAKLYSGLHPNKDEVEDYKWVNWKKLDADIALKPELYSFWFKDQLQSLPSR
jgi:isopentenyl-diphosphate delta-isomerase